MDKERKDPEPAVNEASRVLRDAGFSDHIILVENGDKSVVSTTMHQYETLRYLVAASVETIRKLDQIIAAREAQEN